MQERAVEPTKEKDEDIEYMTIGTTTYKVTSYYDGDISLIDLLKTALMRDADAVLRRVENP